MTIEPELFFQDKSLQAILVELAIIASKKGDAAQADVILEFLTLSGANDITLLMIRAIKGLSLKRYTEVLSLLKPQVERGGFELLPFAVLAASMAGLESELEALIVLGKNCDDQNVKTFCEHYFEEMNSGGLS